MATLEENKKMIEAAFPNLNWIVTELKIKTHFSPLYITFIFEDYSCHVIVESNYTFERIWMSSKVDLLSIAISELKTAFKEIHNCTKKILE